MNKHWCMCTTLKAVYRDCYSTCSICDGQDAYGGSESRPADKQKRLDTNDRVAETKDN